MLFDNRVNFKRHDIGQTDNKTTNASFSFFCPQTFGFILRTSNRILKPQEPNLPTLYLM